jgi:hypothetical protein
MEAKVPKKLMENVFHFLIFNFFFYFYLCFKYFLHYEYEIGWNNQMLMASQTIDSLSKLAMADDPNL